MHHSLFQEVDVHERGGHSQLPNISMHRSLLTRMRTVGELHTFPQQLEYAEQSGMAALYTPLPHQQWKLVTAATVSHSFVSW